MIFAFPAALLAVSTLISNTQANCDRYTPAFPLPKFDKNSPEIEGLKADMLNDLKDFLKELNSTTTSVSIEVTSQQESLFDFHHSASERDPKRPGADHVRGYSRYRIASITKPFIVLAILQQQKLGKLSLEDSILKYVSRLNDSDSGILPWKDITIGQLISQTSGIPRDLAQQDLAADTIDPTEYGLPPVDLGDYTPCDSFSNYTKPCRSWDLFQRLSMSEPVFAPKQQSTYSNMAFELLGLAIEHVTGITIEAYVELHVLQQLDMKYTSFTQPDDSVSILPKDEYFYWDFDMGIQKAAGGLYSSSADLAKFMRYVLTSYNGISPSLNWISPIAYGTGMNTFYGAPWEIFRTDEILNSTQRPVTFVTKGGGLPSYNTVIIMLPDYGLGVTILVAGNGTKMMSLVFDVIKHMVQTAEAVAVKQARIQHTGVYVAPKDLNIDSSITIESSAAHPLYISGWTSNSTDELRALTKLFMRQSKTSSESNIVFQLVPTLLFKDEKHKRGEIWRILIIDAQSSDKSEGILGSFCATDIDYASYAGRPLSEVVFWKQNQEGTYDELELTGFRIKLERKADPHIAFSPATEAFQQKLIAGEL